MSRFILWLNEKVLYCGCPVSIMTIMTLLIGRNSSSTIKYPNFPLLMNAVQEP